MEDHQRQLLRVRGWKRVRGNGTLGSERFTFICMRVNSRLGGSYGGKTDFYGIFVDWISSGGLPLIGLRFQYRVNLYRAPNLTRLYTSVGAFTHTAEPMIGAYFRF